KKIFTRIVKDKRKRSKDKEDVDKLEADFMVKFNELRNTLIDKLFTVVNGKTSQGVMNELGEEVLPKGKKYTQKMLTAIEDFAHLTKGSWTADAETNEMVNDLIHNYKIKLNDLQGALRREKFTIT